MFVKNMDLKSWRVARGYTLAVPMRALKRGAGRPGRQLRRRVICSLTCCSAGAVATVPYRRLYRSKSYTSEPDKELLIQDSCYEIMSISSNIFSHNVTADLKTPEADDTVVVKVGMLGDMQTGKTSFMMSYVSAEQEQEDQYVQTVGVSSREKICKMRNAQIAFTIWDLGGHEQFVNLLPLVCSDAAVIMLVFDLTRRCTLHSVKLWFMQARLHNKTALPVLVGTKYDSFVTLPEDVKALITRQARLYAKAMGAALFFSSVKHNINVSKIFKVIVAKLFDLPCNISRNYTIGEPIVHY